MNEPSAATMDAEERAFRFGPLTGLAAARLLAAAISGLWFVVAARQLSLTDFGNLATLLALVAIAVTVNDAGLQIVLMDHVGRAGRFASDMAGLVVRRRLVYAAVCAVALVPVYLLSAKGTSPWVPVIAAGSLLGTAVYQTLLSGYRVAGHVRMDAANEVLSRVGVLVVGYLWLRAGGGLIAAVSVYALADLCSAVVVALAIRRHLAPPGTAALPDLRLRSTAPVAVAIVLAVVYNRVDVYLLRLLRGATQAGLYGAAYRLLDVALVGGLVLSQIVMRHVAPRAGSARLDEVHRFARRAALVGLGVSGVAALLAAPVLTIAFGPSFEPAVPMAWVLLASAVPGCVSLVMSPIAAIASRTGYVLATAAVLVANVVLNLLLIPPYGGMGAAFATLGCQFAYALALYWIVRQSCAGRRPRRPVADPR